MTQNIWEKHGARCASIIVLKSLPLTIFCIEGHLHAGFGFLWEIRETKNGDFSSHGWLRLADQLRKISEASAVGVLVENPMETPSSCTEYIPRWFSTIFFSRNSLKNFQFINLWFPLMMFQPISFPSLCSHLCYSTAEKICMALSGF